MALIRPDTVSFIARISEDELRRRLADEVLESIGAIGPDGKRAPGIATKVNRGPSRVGGYTIEVTGPMPPRLLIPGDA